MLFCCKTCETSHNLVNVLPEPYNAAKTAMFTRCTINSPATDARLLGVYLAPSSEAGLWLSAV